MTVGWRGGAIELTLSLPIALAKLALTSSGSSPGISFRQRMTGPEGGHEELEAGMVWAARHAEDDRSIQTLHTVMAGQPLFAGILPSDRKDKIGVRFWGTSPTVNERKWLCDVLRTEFIRPTTRVRVRGYRSDFGLPQADEKPSTAHVEARALFGPDVEVVTCNHMQKSGLRNPVWDLTIRGIPPDWQGAQIPSMDSRQRDKSWHLCSQVPRSAPLQSMGPRALLPLPLPPPASEDEEIEEESDAGSAAMELDPKVQQDLKDQFHPKD
jgi:hypothetical protein